MSAASDSLPADGEDSAFFDGLYTAHHRAVYAYLLGHLCDADSAADVLQETFLRVWRHLREARQVPHERRLFWLFAIAKNLLRDHYRRQAVRERGEETLRIEAATHPVSMAPESALLIQETAAAVDAAIRRLPNDLRLALTLHLSAGMNSIEIGKALECPAGTIRYRISQARQRIARELSLESEKTD